MEGDRFEREDGLACPVHWLDIILETHRGGRADAQLTSATYVNCRTCNRNTNNAGDKGGLLGSCRADADGVGLGRITLVADIDIVIARGEIGTGSETNAVLWLP